MNIEQTQNQLSKSGINFIKKGYKSDGAGKFFMVHTLELLKKIEENTSKRISVKPKNVVTEIKFDDKPTADKYLLRDYVNSFKKVFIEKWRQKHIEDKHISIPEELFDEIEKL